jgi:hypothetical protein
MKNQVRFSFILIIALVGRFTLLDAGFLNDLDEYLFVWIQKNDGLLFNPNYWFKAVNEVQAQLPELFIRSIQFKILSLLNPNSSCLFSVDNLKWIGIINAFVVILQAVLLRKIILSFYKNPLSADLSIALWLVFANTNLYCRHILPYDHSLLFWLFAVYFSLSENKSKHWLSGIFAALGLLTYWGSIPALFFYSFSVIQRFRFFKSLPFFLPFIIIFLGFEFLAQLNNFSYFSFLISYQTTIHRGNFDEGFSFPFLYLFQVEKVTGALFLSIFLGSLFLIRKKSMKAQTNVLYPTVFSFLLFSSLVYFANIFVWYGRVVHFILPFLILSSHQVFELISKRIYISCLFGFILVVVYGFQLFSWNKIFYPRNFIENQVNKSDKKQFKFETKVGLRLDNSPFVEICYKSKKSNNQGKILLVNAGFLLDYPSSKFLNSKQKIKIPKSYKLTKAGLHFQSHPFYQFEYNDRIGRNYFDKNRFQIRLYRFESDFSR